MGNLFSSHHPQYFYQEVDKFCSVYDKYIDFIEIKDHGAKEFCDHLKNFRKTCNGLKEQLKKLENFEKDVQEGTKKGAKWAGDMHKSFSNYKSQQGAISEPQNSKSKPSSNPDERSGEEIVPRQALQQEIDTLHQSVKEYKDRIESMNSEIQRVKKENDKVKKEKEEAIMRYSDELSAKVSADERNIENVNIRNRPMNVAAEYEFLNSNLWLDAKTCLDEQLPKEQDTQKLMLLSGLLQVAEKTASIKYIQTTNHIYGMISLLAEKGGASVGKYKVATQATDKGKKAMTSMDEKIADEWKKSCDSIPTNVINAIGDFLRTTSDSVDVTAITEDCMTKVADDLKKMSTKFTFESKQNKGLVKYVEGCAKLAWKMASQRPPMKFNSTSGIKAKWKGEKEQDLYYLSENPQSAKNVVLFYVNPALVHDKSVMVKGRVYVGPEDSMPDTRDSMLATARGLMVNTVF